MADFDSMADKGVKSIVMSKRKYEDFKRTLVAKESTKHISKEDWPEDILKINLIHTDFGKISIKTEEDYLNLSVGQEVKFNSPYEVGDLIKYKHGGGHDKDPRTHYSKIIRIIPYINDTTFCLQFKYVMENSRTVPFMDVLSMEKKGITATQQALKWPAV